VIAPDKPGGRRNAQSLDKGILGQLAVLVMLVSVAAPARRSASTHRNHETDTAPTTPHRRDTCG
jgi:hypothetical protein